MLLGLSACGAEETISLVSSTNITLNNSDEDVSGYSEDEIFDEEAKDEYSESGNAEDKSNSSNKIYSSNQNSSKSKRSSTASEVSSSKSYADVTTSYKKYSYDNQDKLPLGNNYDSSAANPSSSKKSSSSNKDSASSGKKYPTKQKIITIRKNNQDKFKKVGRWNNEEYGLGISLNWSCSSVEFNVDCKDELAVDFGKGSGSQPLYIEIYVDGKLISDRTKIETSGQITIAAGLEPGIHNVKIVRQSDIESPTLTLIKVLAFGNLVDAPKDNSLYIESIGDASIIGWGVRLDDEFYKDYKQNTSTKQSVARNKENQDGTLAYPYVAAQKLGADSYIFARQGAGIAATYHKKEGYCNPRAGLLPTMYEYTHISGNKQYEATRVPDVFVIDAGSADLDTGLLSVVKDGTDVGIDAKRAVSISTEFLKTLKAINPNAKIIWCYGLTRDNEKLEKYISDVTSAAGGESNGIYMLKLPHSKRGGGYPATDYPSSKEHEDAATVLANKIKQITK